MPGSHGRESFKQTDSQSLTSTQASLKETAAPDLSCHRLARIAHEFTGLQAPFIQKMLRPSEKQAPRKKKNIEKSHD